MSNLIDYLDKVKDLPFDQEPLNILDKVFINEIGYLTYEKWLSASDLKETINLHDYAEGKDLNPDYSFMVTKERVDLAEAMVRSRRFAGLNLSDYCSVLDKEVEKQFAAMIFSLPELDYQQIVFRGTFLPIAQPWPFWRSTCQTSVTISLFLDTPRVAILPSIRLFRVRLSCVSK